MDTILRMDEILHHLQTMGNYCLLVFTLYVPFSCKKFGTFCRRIYKAQGLSFGVPHQEIDNTYCHNGVVLAVACLLFACAVFSACGKLSVLILIFP